MPTRRSPPRVNEELVACRGRRDAVRRSHEQRGADQVLEASDLAAHGGLRQVEARGRAADALFLVRGRECAQPA
jgi:hypothetical protein